MNQLCRLDELLVERFETRSGPIRRSQTNVTLDTHRDPHMDAIIRADHHCGVLFTEASPGSEEQAKQLSPDQLLHASIPNNKFPGEYFKVVGGYFLSKKMKMESGKPKVVSCTATRLFGCISSFPAYFGIKEGGTTFLNETFELLEPKYHKKYLDELARGREGWTLIVTPSGKVRGEFPASGEPVILFGCPPPPTVMIKEKERDPETITFELSIQLSCGTPSTIAWKLGDGQTASDQEKVTHTYKVGIGRKMPVKGSVTVILTEKEKEICKLISPFEFIIDRPCPEAGYLKKKIITDKTSEINYDFHVIHKDPAPTRFLWDFGDGSAQVTTDIPSISHKFARKENEEQTFQVKVDCSGPGKMCGFEGTTTVDIPPISCPVINASAEITDQNENTTEIEAVALLLSGPSPLAFHWDWGDGSPVEKTQLGEAAHTYPTPLCTSSVYLITVRWEAPEGCSNGGDKISITIPHLTGTIESISLKSAENGEGLYQVTSEAKLSHGWEPTSFTFDWGDGSPVVPSPSPSNTHTFPIRYGQGEKAFDEYAGAVTASGPGACEDSKDMIIEVPRKACPIFRAFNIQEEKDVDHAISVSCEVHVVGKLPTLFMWDWDDGSEIEYTAEPRATHTFAAPAAGEECLIHKIVCKGEGPDKCAPSISASCTVCPPGCPAINDIQIISRKEVEENKIEVVLKVILSGGAPQRFEWNWGRGMIDTTKTPRITKIFQQPEAGKEIRCPVEVTSYGPGSCKAAKNKTFILKGERPVSIPPFWCRIIPYIVGFFTAMTFSSLITCYVTEVLDRAVGESLPMIGLGVSGVGLILSLAWWLIYTTKRDCTHTVCDWLAIGSAGMLGASTISFLLRPCGLSFLVPLLFVVLTTGLVFWHSRRNCIKKDGIKVILIFLGLGILAALLIFWLVADPTLECM